MDRLLKALPFLTAFFIAVAAMPTNVVQVNAKQMGTEHTQPYRAKSLTGLDRLVGAARTRLTALVEMLAGHPMRGPALAGVAMLVAAFVAPEHTSFAMVGVMGSLSLARTKASSLEADRRKLVKERADLGAKALTENRAMTAEEKATFAELGTKITGAEAAIEDHRDILAASEAQAAIERDPIKTPAVTDADTATTTKATKVVLGKNHADDDPSRGYRDHKELLADVMEAGKTGRISAKLKPLQATQGSDEQGVYSDPHGGFLVPKAVMPGLLTTSAEKDWIAPLVTSVSPMTAPTVSFNARVDKDHTTSVSGGFTVSRRPETVDGTASRATLEQVTLTANEEFGGAFASERILHDSPQSFVAIIAAGFDDEFANNAIKERLRGSGVGERLGILHANNTALVSQAKETGQVADTIVKENIDKMAARAWRYANSVWVANHDTRPQLRSLVQNIGTGGMAVSYFESGAGGEKLDGRPIYFTEHANKLGDAGDLILVDWSQYLEGEYESLQQAESIHVRFMAAERAFRFYKRNDGRPWWRAAMVPAQSAQTLSPFIVLAAR